MSVLQLHLAIVVAYVLGFVSGAIALGKWGDDDAKDH